MKRFIKRLPIALLVALMVSVGIGGTVSAQTTPELYWTEGNTPITGTLAMSGDGERTITLKTDIPADRTLNAFTFTIKYNPTVVGVIDAVKADDAVAGLNVIPNPNTPGTIVVGGFTVDGVTGATTSIVDITLKGLVGGFTSLDMTVNEFSSGTNLPIPVNSNDLPITVSNITTGPHEIFWADPSSNWKIDGNTLNLENGESDTIRLMVGPLPSGKTLKAYNVTVAYDTNITEATVVQAYPAGSITKFHNSDTPGVIAIDGFNENGIAGAEQLLAIVDIDIKGLNEGTSVFNIGVNGFGESKNEQFRPISVPLTVNVSTSTPSDNETYWAETDGTRFDGDALLLWNGEEKVIRLMAEVPEGKTLRAYRYTLTYDTSLIEVVNIDRDDMPNTRQVNNSVSGVITLNGFDDTEAGIPGPATVAIIDVTIKGAGIGGPTDFNMAVNDFGDNKGDQFKPATNPLAITVQSIPTGETEVYFVNEAGETISTTDLTVTDTEKVTLMAKVPEGDVLKAYKITLSYGSNIQVVSFDDTVSPFGNQANTNSEAGTLVTNAFDALGNIENQTVEIIELTLQGVNANTTDALTITVNEFGNTENQFPPIDDNITNLAINVLGDECGVAVLTATPTYGDAPLTVTFNTTGSSGDLSINYGDGQTGTATSHTYTSPGTYNAVLTATSGACSKTATQTIRVSCPAVAIFSYNVGDDKVTVTFDSAGSSANGNITWNFGDGQTGTGTNPTHVYPAVTQNYTVTMTVTTPECSETYTRAVSIVVCDAVAKLTHKVVGSTVTFDTTGSVGNLAGFVYGDGQTGTETTHLYASEGTYTATVRIVDTASGCEDTASVQVVIIDGEVYDITVDSVENGKVMYDGVNVADTVVKVNTGDTPTFTFVADAEHVVANVSVDETPYGSLGSFIFAPVEEDHRIEVTFRLIDITLEHDITVASVVNGKVMYNDNDVSGKTVKINDGDTPKFVFVPDDNYRVSGVSVDGISVGVVNDFTFGPVTTGHSLSVTFIEIDESVVITVTSGANGSVTYNDAVVDGDIIVDVGDTPKFVFVPNDGYMVASVSVDGTLIGAIDDFTFTPVTDDHNLSVTFIEIDEAVVITVSSDANGSVTYNDAVVDGEVIFGAGDTPTFTFVPNDDYEVDAVYVDGTLIGAVDSFTFEPLVADYELSVIFRLEVCNAEAVLTPDKVTGDKPLTVKFDTTGSAGDLVIDFGDDTTATPASGETVEHAYQTAGEYKVTLTATDTTVENCSKVVEVTITVTEEICLADAVLSASPISVYIGDTVTFNTAGSAGNLSIDYKDGQTATVTTTTVKHSYSSKGTYNVTLTAYDADNDCNDYAYATIYVDDDDCTSSDANAVFTASPTTGDAPLTVTFNTAGSVGNLFFTYGDGQTGTGTTHTYEESGRTYTVTLTATGNGCTSKAYRTITTTCDAVATFTATTDDRVATFVTTGSVGNLTWNYGDGETGTDAFHTYDTDVEKTYSVTLTATDPDDSTCVRTQTKSVKITPVTVTCDAEAAFTFDNTNYLIVSFDAAASVGDSFAWDFGDGSSGTGQTTSHEYNATQTTTYNVTLTVTRTVETCTDTDTITKPVTVTPEPVVVEEYTITSSAGDNGGIYPDGEIIVASGNNARYTFMSDIGYKVSEVLIDGQPVTVATYYQFDNVTEDHTILVNFEVEGNYYIDPQTGTRAPWEKRVEVDVKPVYFPDLTSEATSMVKTFDDSSAWGVQLVTAGVSIASLDSMGAMGLDTPKGESLPLGLVAYVFEIGSCSSSDSANTVEVDIFFRDPLPSNNDGVKWIHYDRDNNNIVEMPATFNDDNNDGYYESVTLNIEDGGEFDLDGEVNCQVSGLSGLAIGIATFTYSTNALTASFEASTQTASGLDMLVECITWNFGDGEEDTSCAQTSTDGLHTTVTHTYAEEGTYAVTLAVKGANGDQSDPQSVKVSVTPEGDGGGDNCFISASAYDSTPKSGMNIALLAMLMTLAGMAVSFFRKSRK
ncbi:MAG: PKD domain-containing protein [Desulfobacterales bacterium]|nr:PKD domain-containing protein [Desulfobacterales bacterium]